MIGGNVILELQSKTDCLNEIGENVPTWHTVQRLKGFIDNLSGEAKNTYDTKLLETTHIFIADFCKLHNSINEKNCRAIIGYKEYNIVKIDNPMGLNKHFEIYLKYVGE